MDLDEKEAARLLGFVRAMFGVVTFLAPNKSMRAWTGAGGDEVATAAAARGLGARDIALGVGLLIAMDQETPVRGWLEAGALADAGDALASLAAFPKVGPIRGTFMLASTIGAAWFGMKLAAELE